MALQRDGYHHGDLRNALVASAVRLIEASGTSSFSLREAAREVGVSANAAYRHFDDKSALMTAVAAFGFRQLATQMVGAMASAAGGRAKGPASVARFKAVGRAYVEFAVAHPELFRVMFGECGAECRKAEPTGVAPALPSRRTGLRSWARLLISLRRGSDDMNDGALKQETRSGGRGACGS